MNKVSWGLLALEAEICLSMSLVPVHMACIFSFPHRHGKQLLRLAAETDLLQHMKRLASCTMVHKTQDMLGLELLKEFLEYDCGIQQECIIEGPNVSKVVEEAQRRSIVDHSEPLNPQRIQSVENSAVLLRLLRSCQVKGGDAAAVIEFLRKTLVNKWPDGEKATQEASKKEQQIDDGCWFVFQRICLPEPFQKNLDKGKRGFEQSHFKDLRCAEEQENKGNKLSTVFNSIMMLPKLLREEEEKMLLQSLRNMSRGERTVYLKQHGLLQNSPHNPFIPGLSERPRGLWTEPKAFKVQHKKIFTRPVSPFSNDRMYNIKSLKENFHMYKSEKEPTQFIQVKLPQMASDSSSLQRMRLSEGSSRQNPSNAPNASNPPQRENFDKNCPSFLPVMETPGNQEVPSSDTDSEILLGQKVQKPQQKLTNEMPALEQQSFLPSKFPSPWNEDKVDGDKGRQSDDSKESSFRQTDTSLAKKVKRRKSSAKDIDIHPGQQNNLPEINQMQRRMRHSQELDSASQSNFKSDSEGTAVEKICCPQKAGGLAGTHEMNSDPNKETSSLSAVSLQSTGKSEVSSKLGMGSLPLQQKESISDTKKNKYLVFSTDPMEYNMSHQREPDSLVHQYTSAERTKSHPVQPIAFIPSDAFEECNDKQKQKVEKPPDAGDDRLTNEQAAEALVTGKQEGERLPRAGLTKRKPLPHIKRGFWRKSQSNRVMMEETQRVRPTILDFLTKYCIINPERLSFYERIFLKYCSHEDPDEEPRDQESTDMPNANFGQVPGGFDHVEEILIQKKAKENIDIEKKIQMILESGPVSDQLEKMQFKMKTLLERKKDIVNTVQELQDQRMQLQATMTEQLSNTTKQKKGQKRRKGKDTKLLLNMDGKGDNLCGIPSSKLSSMLVKQADAYENLDLKIKLFWSKYKEICSRLSELSDTKRILEQKNKEAYLESIVQNSKIPPEERRLQSALYQRLHPDKDFVLDLNDLEQALQDVNKCLVSPKEFSYIFHILELPGQQYRLNLELFCVVAALSEKVTQLDPVIKKLVNKLDFEALSVRIEKAKDLWHLLQDDEEEKGRKTNRTTGGSVSIRRLALELAAGGFSLEAINFALQKFNRGKAGVLSFLDFVTYIPLFVEIHEGIVQNPLSLVPNTVPDLEDELHLNVI
ncbi:Hypothetical predicted protein [Podarcis lilfordi]|uniref:Uncharacterized protein n=1 Tax=Podarcis lilfordi TaxID=74358 RepID=A0AA35K1L5_9SAUR|nr:Hypothetical predicted protein [Podarcis lilfordi]